MDSMGIGMIFSLEKPQLTLAVSWNFYFSFTYLVYKHEYDAHLGQVLQILRNYRYPVSGERLAERLNISIRTLYRDIATLQTMGADIIGEVGVGYILKPTFFLPPLMFTQNEIQAFMVPLFHRLSLV